MPHHREYVGRVISDKMQKTVVVLVEWTWHHPLYKKAVRRRTKFYAHDPRDECREGDIVRIVEVRPLSKTKRWLVKEILRRGQRVEAPPPEAVEVPEAGTAPAGEAVQPSDEEREP